MAKNKVPEAFRKHEDTWICRVCEDDPLFEEPLDYLAHLREEHPALLVDGTKLRAKRNLLQALDGRDWYSNTYQYLDEQGKEIAQRAESGPRGKDDPMRYG